VHQSFERAPVIDAGQKCTVAKSPEPRFESAKTLFSRFDLFPRIRCVFVVETTELLVFNLRARVKLDREHIKYVARRPPTGRIEVVGVREQKRRGVAMNRDHHVVVVILALVEHVGREVVSHVATFAEASKSRGGG
jgi:hypothetical protein